MRTSLAYVLFVIVGLFFGNSAVAQTESVLYPFQGGSDGASPFAALTKGKAGVLYGTAYTGGIECGDGFGCGTLFMLTPPSKQSGTWSFSVLHAFEGGQIGDGALPTSAPMIDNKTGTIFGTTYGGGDGSCSFNISTNCGTVWAFANGALAVLYSFQGGNDGAIPWAGVVKDGDGNLFGTTQLGGGSSNCGGAGCGTVYELSPPPLPGGAWTENILHAFQGDGQDGRYPEGSLVIRGGVLYGQTDSTVFKLVSSKKHGVTTWTLSTLYTYPGSTTTNSPAGALIFDDAGNLYGTDPTGGTWSVGEVFKLAAPPPGQSTWTPTTIATFGCPTYNGCGPLSNVGQTTGGVIMDSSGALYGSATEIAYKLTPPVTEETNWTPSILHTFSGSPDGLQPIGGLVDGKWSKLYGTTKQGGSGYGTIYEITQ